MFIQITLDANSYLHIIPIRFGTLCFDYNYGYCKLKSLSLINAFFYTLNDKITKQLYKLVEGYSLRFYYHSENLSLVFPEKFRNNLRKFRYELEINNKVSDFFKLDSDTLMSFYNLNYHKINTELPVLLNINTYFKVFEVLEKFDDSTSIRLMHCFIISKCQVIRTENLVTGGIIHLIKPPVDYKMDEINHFNKMIHELYIKCERYGWCMKYKYSGYPDVMVLSIYRYAYNRNEVTNLQLWEICEESYRKLH